MILDFRFSIFDWPSYAARSAQKNTGLPNVENHESIAYIRLRIVSLLKTQHAIPRETQIMSHRLLSGKFRISGRGLHIWVVSLLDAADRDLITKTPEHEGEDRLKDIGGFVSPYLRSPDA